MLLSVCIPTFNRADLLGTTLQALLAQARPEDVEVVVCDNASTDDTGQVVEAARARTDVHVRYCRHAENIGLDANVVATLERAHGQYIWFLSDDDVPLPGAVAKLLGTLRKHQPRLVYLGHAGFREDEPYTVVQERVQTGEDVVLEDGAIALREHLLVHFSAIVLRREAALRFLPQLAFYESVGCTRGYTPGVLAHYVAVGDTGPIVIVGSVCLACRNPIDFSYDIVKSVLIDTALHIGRLVRQGMLDRESGRAYLNQFLRGVHSVVIPQRLSATNAVSPDQRRTLFREYLSYPRAYLYLFPFLAMPRPVLRAVYWVGLRVKRAVRTARASLGTPGRPRRGRSSKDRPLP